MKPGRAIKAAAAAAGNLLSGSSETFNLGRFVEQTSAAAEGGTDLDPSQ
jgi:hypothetical protein